MSAFQSNNQENFERGSSEFRRIASRCRPELASNILLLKEQLFELIKNVNPLEIMVRIMRYSELICFNRALRVEKELEEQGFSSEDIDDNNAYLIPEFLQSSFIMLPSTYSSVDHQEIDEKRIMMVISICEQIIEEERLLTFFTSISDQEPNTDDARVVEEYLVEASSYLALRGRRYTVLERKFLSPLLGAQNELIESIFGVTSDQLIDGVLSIANSIAKGRSKAITDFGKQLEVHDPLDRDNPAVVSKYKTVINDEIRDLIERFAGAALYDVEKVAEWPASVIDSLSLHCYSGNDRNDSHEQFLDVNPCGVLPIAKKPFISINGKSYCFSYANLLDNFYRTLYKALKETITACASPITDKKTFEIKWKENQTEASESMAVDILQSLLPGSFAYRNVFHPTKGIEPTRKNLQECDAIISFDDCMLLVEVKGGSFCPTDPVDDPDNHIRSFKKLIESASVQAQSTLDYITRCDTIAPFFDKNGNQVMAISTGQIREYFKLCVSVDDINEFASKAEKLQFLSIPRDTIVLSLDDLLVYEAYFDNPLRFIHYLLQRREATGSPYIRLNDELDHLGLYIEWNQYPARVNALIAEEDVAINRVVFDGMRDNLNRWFEMQFIEPESDHSALRPKQPSHPMFDSLIESLGVIKDDPNRRIAACSLLDADEESRRTIGISLNQRANALWIPPNCVYECSNPTGKSAPISIFTEKVDSPNDISVCQSKTIAALLGKEEERRIMINLSIDCGQITKCSIWVFERACLSKQQIEAANPYINPLQEMRKTAIAKQLGRKIGRNEPCPCGSGKKYKKCCGK